MDGHGSNVLAVLVHVVRSKRSGQHDEVDLDRGRLPFAAQRVLDLDVDLRGVERAVLRLEPIGFAERIKGGLDLGLSSFPQRRVAEGPCPASSQR